MTRAFVILICASAYIVISEEIWRGGYGINLGEIAVLSSSVIYLLLLEASRSKPDRPHPS